MQYREKLIQLRTEAFRKTEVAAKKGQTTELNRMGRIPKECEDAMELLDSLESQITRIEADLCRTEPALRTSDPRPAKIGKSAIRLGSKASPRQKANEVRKKYVNDLNDKLGIRLRRRSEVIYQTESGKSVGLPYATELANLPDRWWLGLPDEHFDFVVLLCENGSGDLLDFVFPSDFVSEIWRSLSRDGKLHVKFNVFRRSADYELRLAGVAKRIRRFLGADQILS